MRRFVDVQDGLAEALGANRPDSGVPHVVIALPSYSVGESLLAHYGDRLLALEHRYLVSTLLAHRLADVEVVYISSVPPSPEVVDHYRSMGPDPAGFTARTHLLSLDDRAPRCVAQKLLERGDVLDGIRQIIGVRPALLEPWNVTEHEMAVSERLGVPINGMAPELRPLGFKGAGRRLFREVSVPVPRGTEGVRSVDDVVAAAVSLQALPGVMRVVVKHDDSGAGDGNAVLEIRDAAGAPLDRAAIREQVTGLADWYLADLARGGVVEEFLNGDECRSPSAQLDLLPDGSSEVKATHEQLLGGENGQVFLGCRFPADVAYAAEIARHAQAVGRRLAGLGVIGRVSIDFIAVRDEGAAWRTYALEANLRKGGTTHPFTALRNLVPGHYDPAAAAWIAADGGIRSYVCTDNCVDPSWVGLPPRVVIDAVVSAGLGFDHMTGVGAVLHMLDGLGVDGRFGLIAIGEDPDHAQELCNRTLQVVQDAASRRPVRVRPGTDRY
jgi:PGM1 C-terminal domain